MTRKEQFVLLALAVAVGAGAAALFLHDKHIKAEIPPPEVEVRVVHEQEAPPEIESLPEEPEAGTAPVALATPPAVVAKEPGGSPPGRVTVSVVGAVHNPGVYELGPESRVEDLLEFAGGAKEAADLTDINLAAPLIDGTSLIVPQGSLSGMQGGTLVVRGAVPRAVNNPPQYTISGWRPDAHQTGAVSATESLDGQGSPSAGGLMDLNRASAAELESLPGIGPKLASEIIRYRRQMPFQRVEDVMNVSGIGTKRFEAIQPFVTVASPK